MTTAEKFAWRRRAAGEPGPDFPTFGLGHRLLYLRRDFSSQVPIIFTGLGQLESSGSQGKGNRQSGFTLKLSGGPDLFVRHAHRGGMIRHLLKDIHVGLHPRPVRELAVAAEAQRRGIPVAEPVGAVVDWLAPMAYRGAFLTRAMSGLTLWELIRTDDDAYVRAHVLEQARRAIDTMHQLGLFHADLNLHNLFVTQSRDSFAVAILDLDRSRLFRTAVPPGLRRRNFSRLLRSARKLDPDGRFLDARALASLTGA